MLVAPSRDWNVFKQIFAEHWDGFTRAHPRYQTAYYHGLVAKMLDFVLAGILWFFFLGWLIHLWSIIDAARYTPPQQAT